jgi:hypothetical protein
MCRQTLTPVTTAELFGQAMQPPLVDRCRVVLADHERGKTDVDALAVDVRDHARGHLLEVGRIGGPVDDPCRHPCMLLI